MSEFNAPDLSNAFNQAEDIHQQMLLKVKEYGDELTTKLTSGLSDDSGQKKQAYLGDEAEGLSGRGLYDKYEEKVIDDLKQQAAQEGITLNIEKPWLRDTGDLAGGVLNRNYDLTIEYQSEGKAHTAEMHMTDPRQFSGVEFELDSQEVQVDALKL